MTRTLELEELYEVAEGNSCSGCILEVNDHTSHGQVNQVDPLQATHFPK